MTFIDFYGIILVQNKYKRRDLNAKLKVLDDEYSKKHSSLLSSKKSLTEKYKSTEDLVVRLSSELDSAQARLVSAKDELRKIEENIKSDDESYKTAKKAILDKIESLKNEEKSLRVRVEKAISDHVLSNMDLFNSTLLQNMHPVIKSEEKQVLVSIKDTAGVDKYLRNTTHYRLVGYTRPDGKIITRGIKSCAEDFRLVKVCLEIANNTLKGTLADIISKLDYVSEKLDKLLVYIKTDEGFKVMASTSTVTDEDIDKVFTSMNSHKNNTKNISLMYGACAKWLVTGIRSNIKHLPSETIRNTLRNIESLLSDSDYKLVLEVI